jgi:hypothetical protein
MSNGKVWHTAPDSCEGGPPPNNAINRTPDQVVFVRDRPQAPVIAGVRRHGRLGSAIVRVWCSKPSWHGERRTRCQTWFRF